MRTWLTTSPRTDKRRKNKKSAALARRQWQIGRLEWLEQRVLLAADLGLSETVNPNPALPGEMVNYQIAITNTGGAPTSPVTVTDTIPSQLHIISVSPSEGTATISGQVVTANYPSLAVGDVQYLQIKVTPTASSASPVSDSATASDNNGSVTSSAPLTINSTTATSVQDLVVTKTATATSNVLEGQEINFTITVHNTDTTNTAHNVVVSDILPAGEDYLNTEGDSTGIFKLSGKQLTDNMGDVAPGATVMATYDVLITKAGTLTDTATATTSSGITNASSGDNVTSLSIDTAAAPNGANLAVTKTASPTTVAPGQDVTYTIDVANNGSVAAQNVELTDLLPLGMNYVSSTPAAGSSNIIIENGSVVDEIGTMQAGGTATLTIVASPDASLAGQTVTNQACATTTTGDTDPTDNCGFASVTVGQPGTGAANVSIAKSGPTSGTVGQQLTYTITVVNAGTSAASNVTVTDVLPATGETLDSTNDSLGGSLTQHGNVLSETIASLAAGATDTITVKVTPNQAGTFTDTASIGVPAGNSNPNTTSSVTTVVTGAAVSPNVSIAKTGPATGTVGQQLTYTITVTNNDNSHAASNVAISDTLPSGETLDSATASSGNTVNQSGNTLSETVSSLAAGATETITVIVTPDQTGSFTDTANVNVSGNVGSPTSASVTTNVSAAVSPNVSIAKTGPSTGTVGHQLTYTITVTNNDNSHAASNVAISDTLPSGETLDSATASSGNTVNQSGNTLSETVSSLAAGATETITVIVTPNQTGSFTDTANVNVSGNVGSPTSASVTTNVSAAVSPNVSIAKTGPSTGTVGHQLTYTITVTNNDNSHAASNVSISDTLPSGETLVSTTASSGNTVSQSGNTLSETLGSLAASGTETIVVIVTPNQTGSFTDTANVNVSGNVGSPTSASVTTNVSAAVSPNVSIAKTGPSTGTVGQHLTYTITVTNNDSSHAASNVSISDTLPSGETLVSATASSGNTVNQSGNTLSEALGSLAASGTETITVIVTPNQAGSFTDTANVNVSGNVGSPTSASVTTNVSAVTGTNVSINKTGPANATVGTAYDYTITVTNSGSSAASNVSISDTIPAGVTLVTASGNQGDNININGSQFSDTLNSLAAGAVDTIVLHVLPNAAGTVTNTASVNVTGNTSNQTTSSVTTVIGTTGVTTNVSVTKTGPSNATVGTGYAYTITVKNNGSAAASNVSISDALPGGVLFVSASDNQGGTISQTGQQFGDVIGSLAAGATDTITLNVLPTAAGTVTNTASVNVTGNTSNQTTSSVTTTIGGVSGTSVSVIKTGPATATVGTGFDYTIKVINNGSAAARNVTVSDTLPGGLTVGAASDNEGGTITENGTAFTDVISSLPAGATDTITLHVTPTASGSITNTATVQVSGNTSNQTTSSVTTVVGSGVGQANVSVVKNGPSTGVVGQALTYTIVITNSGSSAANNVAFTDNLASSLSNVSASDSLGGTVSLNGGVLSETIGSLAAGASDTIIVTATPTQAGTIVNTANITVPGGNQGQSSSSVTTTVTSTQPITGHTCFENGQPGDGTDQTFVRNLYRELLGRDPDSSGNQAWLNYLATGNPNQNGNGQQSNAGRRHQVIDFFLSSPEYRNHLVNCMYENFLGRQADQGGLQFFVGQLNQGVDEEEVLSGIIGSQEYYADAGGTSQGFVNAMYRDILGRQADSGGGAYWTSQANQQNVPRDQFVREFLMTDEAEHKLLNANYPGAPGATGAPGTPAGGSYGLADMTGGGWENLYFQGTFLNGQNEAHNDFFAKLQGNTPWDDVIEDMLETQHYYNASQGN